MRHVHDRHQPHVVASPINLRGILMFSALSTNVQQQVARARSLHGAKTALVSALMAFSASAFQANAQTQTHHQTNAAPTKPDALLQIDLNRAAVVERIVNSWNKELQVEQRESFKAKLNNLRADQLLAANISGTFDGVLEVMQSQEKAAAFLANARLENQDQAKAVGDLNADVVYTPVNPCRLIDTRGANSPVFSGGAFSPNQTRTYQATGNCAVPTGATAVVMQIIMIAPTAAGDIEVLPQGGTFGGTVAMVFQSNVYSSVSLAAKLNQSNGQFATQIRGPGGHVAMDVVGYFKAPASINGTLLTSTYRLPQGCANGQVAKYNTSTTAWDCGNDNTGTGGGGSGTVTNIATGSGLTGGPITTTGTINLATSQLLPTTACATNQIPKWNGTAWACGADNSPTNAWTQGGNAFGAAGVIGTTDAQNLTVQSGGSEVSVLLSNGDGLRITQSASGSYPNVINGDRRNAVGNSVGATIGGGVFNVVGDQALYSTIGGGRSNLVGGSFTTIAGGFGNTASGSWSTVAGGNSNTASGSHSNIAGGFSNTASGDYSLAAGRRAKANHHGAFVWGDNTDADIASTGVNQFVVRSGGGAAINATPPANLTAPDQNGDPGGTTYPDLIGLTVGPTTSAAGYASTYLRSNTGGGILMIAGEGTSANSADAKLIFDAFHGYTSPFQQVRLMTLTTPGNPSGYDVAGIARAQTFTSTSDRAAKTAFERLDTRAILERLVRMPVSRWAYKNEAERGVRHIGPVAQDFKQAFNVGYDDKSITSVDAAGVALAAIQGLNQKLVADAKAKDAKISAQDQKINKLESELAAIKRKLGL
jgi:hypothetical protein